MPRSPFNERLVALATGDVDSEQLQLAVSSGIASPATNCLSQGHTLRRAAHTQ